VSVSYAHFQTGLEEAQHALTVSSPKTTHCTRSGVIVLRQSGGKPLKIKAELLAEGSSRTVTSLGWHEIAIYRTEEDGIVVAIRSLRNGGAESCVHRARSFPDTDQAATWLEEFDPSFDLSADFDVADPRASAASVSLKAATLRDRTERLKRDYRCLVGEVLFRLETET